MLGEVNLNGNNIFTKSSENASTLSLDTSKINNLIEGISNSLEDYLSQSIDVIQNQIKLLVDTTAQTSNKYPSHSTCNNQASSLKSLPNLSPHRFNLLVSKIIKINRQKLDDLFKKKLENIKNFVKSNQFYLIGNQNENKSNGTNHHNNNNNNNKINLQQPDIVELDKIVNFDLYFRKTKEILEKFDNFYTILKENIKHKSYQSRSNTSKSKSRSKFLVKQRYTDFSSDTETLCASKFTSSRKYEKIQFKLKNLHLDDEQNSSFSSDEEIDYLNDNHKLENFSDTELNNMSVSYSSMNSNNNLSNLGDSSTDQESNDENNYYGDEETESFENSNALTSATDSSGDEMDEEIIKLCKVFEEATEDEVSKTDKIAEEANDNENNNNNFNSNNNNNNEVADEDDDCIIICESDCKDKKESKKNRYLERIHNLVSNNKENKIRAPIYLGMKVLALKDKFKYKWKLARIVRISDQNLLKNDNENKLNTPNDIVTINKMICNSKYHVIFDCDTEDDQENDECIMDELNDNLVEDDDNDIEVMSDQELSDSIEEFSSNEETNLDDETLKKINKKRKLRSKSETNQVNGTFSGPFVKKRTNMTENRNNNGAYIELDSKSVAFLDKYEKIFPELGYNPITNSPALPPKSRVVSLYQVKITSNDKNRILFNNEYMSSGTIIEVPSVTNFHRYLVLFDNGVASYVKPTHLFPIFDLFGQPVENLNIDHVKFLIYYFNLYPERTMVRLNLDAWITIYLHNKWYNCRVVDIDCSLVTLEFKNNLFYSLKNKNVNFQNNNVSGYHVYSVKLYRGSFSLLPLYEQVMNKISDYGKSETELSSYEDYIKIKKDGNNFYQLPNSKKYLSIFASSIFPNNAPKNHRLLKQKCNMNNNQYQHANNQKSLNDHSKVIQGQIKHLEMDAYMRDEIISFVPHPCTNACVAKWETNANQVRWVNPLLMPVLHGWQRHICHQSKTLNTASKRWINYVAPCGRMLRSTSEVDRYLYLTNSKLTIDMFSFDFFIHTDREFEANAKYVKIEDITNKQEKTIISAVNCIDTSRPEDFEYSAKRIPLEGVPLNVENKLLEGCNCTDNCRDRSKCACWRKTFEATLFTSSQMNTNIGYRGRRLQELVNTGIFECNPNCKCDCRCSNRVVQNGISVRLQLFKTNAKGWGLRCLDDIPKGTFICTYAGHLLTEEQSDIRGKELGDEYFAELDFIECLNQLRNKSYSDNESNNLDEETRSDSLNLNSDSNDSSAFRNKNNRQQRRQLSSNNRTKDYSNHYQRPKQQLQIKKQFLGLNETDYIFLDSDEDEQDRSESNQLGIVSTLPLSKKEDEYNKSRAYNREQKTRRVANSIDSNRFFTNPLNMFYFENFLKESLIFIMDAKTCGNIGRYFNHSCSPNIFVQNVFVDTYDLRFPWISFFASNSIKAGTELCWDYNYTIGSVQDRVLLCHCNSTNCRGRLL